MKSYIWLVLMVVFLIAEASTVTMVSLWFAAGSLVALAAGLLGARFSVQVALFLATSVALLACLRPVVRKHFNPKITKTNVDSVIGSQGYVTEDIDNMDAVGQVKLGGMYWTARSASGHNIPKGTLVKVEKIEGVKAFVTPVRSHVSEEVAQ